MKKSTKLALRASELRGEINDIPAGEDGVAKRRAKLDELKTVEGEYRSALTSESESDAEGGAGGLTPEERERRALESRAELRHALYSIMNDRAIGGAAGELQQAAGMGGNQIPWDLLAPRRTESRAAEHRADAVSAAPADSHLMQHPILGRVFARSATMTLGVPMPMVSVGEQNFPVISAGSTASILAKDGNLGDAGSATISAHTISPRRLQVEYLFRREDAAVLMGLEEALRRDLSSALSDKLDSEVIIGGASPKFGGFLSTVAQGGLVVPAVPGDEVTYALAAGQLALGVDGKYAGSEGELCCVVGDASWRKLSSEFQTGSGENATGYFRRMSKAVMASSNVPAAGNDHVQDAILARVGAEGMNAVCPIWSGVALIRDEVSTVLRKQGHISVTAIMLAGFDILRADGFQRMRFQIAA